MMRVVRLAWTATRWWLGVTWLVTGIGGIVAAPVMLALGNAGGIYMLIGAPELLLMGWFTVPRRPRLRGDRQGLRSRLDLHATRESERSVLDDER